MRCMDVLNDMICKSKNVFNLQIDETAEIYRFRCVDIDHVYIYIYYVAYVEVRMLLILQIDETAEIS